MAKRESIGIGKRLVEAAIEILADNEGTVGLAELYAALKKKLPRLCNDSDTYKEGWHEGRAKWKVYLAVYSSPKFNGGKPLFEKGNGEWSLTEEGWEWSGRLKSGRKGVFPEPKPKDISAHSDSGLTPEEQAVADYVFNRPIPKRKEGEKAERKGTWFEHTVAALLRGMGYGYVHVTKESWDDGVDVVAYEDDLGIVEPRLKVQVKHQKHKVDHGVILRLANVVHEGEIGICVTSSSFNKSAERFALASNKHLLLVHLERFVQLWVKYYDDITPEDRDRIPVSVKNKKPRRGKNVAD